MATITKACSVCGRPALTGTTRCGAHPKRWANGSTRSWRSQRERILAARELGRLSLDDALSLCVLLAEQDPARFERAGLRWLDRLLVSSTSFGGGTIIPSKVWTPRSADALPAEGMVQSPRTSRRKSI